MNEKNEEPCLIAPVTLAHRKESDVLTFPIQIVFPSNHYLQCHAA